MKNLYEVFAEFESAPDKESKMHVLRANSNQLLKDYLQAAYHPAIQFIYTEPVKWKKSDAPPGLGYSNLGKDFRLVYLWIKDHPKVAANLSQARKYQLLIQLLESLEAKEAELFMNMLLKNPKVKGLNAKIVSETFPGLLP